MKPLLLRAINHEPVSRPPVWLMRQAGRYLVEYRELKEKHSFLGLCKTPELAAQVTLQPLAAFEMDAAIIFADILLPAECLGFEIDFAPGPQVANQVNSAADIFALKTKDVSTSLNYVYQGLTLVKKELSQQYPGDQAKALIGFAGAPWTLACYLINQGPFKQFHGTQVFAAQNPAALHQLLEKLTEVVAEYVIGQVESGADVIQLFDTWAGNLSAAEYERFALPYTQKLIALIKQTGRPALLYINGCSQLLSLMRQSGADVLSLDWRIPLSEAESVIGDAICLQGNFDPTGLFASPAEITTGVKRMLQSMQRNTGYIANVGHGILPLTPRDGVAAFVDAVKTWRDNS